MLRVLWYVDGTHTKKNTTSELHDSFVFPRKTEKIIDKQNFNSKIS